MEVGIRNIEHYRGTTWFEESWQPFEAGVNEGDADVAVAISAVSGKLQLRKTKTGPLVFEWTTDDQTMEITSEYIILKNRSGAEMNFAAGVYEYDLILVHTNGDTVPYARGTFSNVEKVSK